VALSLFGLPVPVIILVIVFVLIAIRQVGRFRLRIWQVMLGGACAVLVLGQITPLDACRSVNPDVMLFLFGMFVVGEAMDRSGYLPTLADRLFRLAHTRDQFILLVLVGMGLFSALLMNDTLAIIGTPLVIAYACRFDISPKTSLLALCFAVTIGSVMSPIGNPQNLLIATYGGLPQPFFSFLTYLGIPTLINLFAAFFLLKWLNPIEKGECRFDMPRDLITDRKLADLCRVSLAIILILIIGRVCTGSALIPLTLIALGGSAPILIFSRGRTEVLRGIDWPTLLFFVSMFILMQSVYLTGFFQGALDFSAIQSIPLILAASVTVSQFISNVPFVALFQPLIAHQGMPLEGVMALAAGSTIAGNLTILGAASNVIIIQNAEKKGYTLTFWDFFRVGLPLTIVNCLVYWLFLSLT
jgi:Na+/H+ antiporter NhaD/arsenite permease-like protein